MADNGGGIADTNASLSGGALIADDMALEKIVKALLLVPQRAHLRVSFLPAISGGLLAFSLL